MSSGKNELHRTINIEQTTIHVLTKELDVTKGNKSLKLAIIKTCLFMRASVCVFVRTRVFVCVVGAYVCITNVYKRVENHETYERENHENERSPVGDTLPMYDCNFLAFKSIKKKISLVKR